jgi:hypothetical protein
MLMIKERMPAIRTLRGWAISVLQEADAIRECEEHGWTRDRADPHARERAFAEARPNRPTRGPVMDAFDRFWQWADKPLDTPLTISAELHRAVMDLVPEDRRDRAKVNEAATLVVADRN